MSSLDCAKPAEELRTAGLTQQAVPPALTDVKQGLFDALLICAVRSGREAGQTAESPLLLDFLRWVPAALSTELAASLGVDWDAPERGSMTQRAALWNAAARRVGDARVPLRHLAGMARLLRWVRDFAPALTVEAADARMFKSLRDLIAAGKLLQPPADGAGEDAAAVPHTVQTVVHHIFNELQLMVDPSSAARLYPGFHQMGRRFAAKAMATLFATAFAKHGGLLAIPQLVLPAEWAEADAAVFVSKSGDTCAACVDTFVDAMCGFTFWSEAIQEMFAPAAKAGAQMPFSPSSSHPSTGVKLLPFPPPISRYGPLRCTAERVRGPGRGPGGGSGGVDRGGGGASDVAVLAQAMSGFLPPLTSAEQSKVSAGQALDEKSYGKLCDRPDTVRGPPLPPYNPPPYLNSPHACRSGGNALGTGGVLCERGGKPEVRVSGCAPGKNTEPPIHVEIPYFPRYS